MSLPYITGSSPLAARSRAGPLGRYLPPIPPGVAAEWLASHLDPGSIVLDPFGTSPRLVLEAARTGYRVVVSANNPITRFFMEIGALPPSEPDLRSALAELAASFKGHQRLEPLIKELYLTDCVECGKSIQADAFLWERQASSPYARLYRCPHCGDSGERPVTEADVARAAAFPAGGLHQARALERVSPLDDPDRHHAEEALAVYLPRAVYALFTLINKLDSLHDLPERRKHAIALLLAACDQANSLWGYPTARDRPRQLSIPSRFRENNVWMALENSIEQWMDWTSAGRSSLTLVKWPQLPPEEGGISIFEGRLKDLAATLPDIPVSAVLSAFPRPNQAFWTLSALWAGWLLGRESVLPLKVVLRRRRYDWSWHTAALTSALSSLAPLLGPGTPFFGLIGETEPGFLTSTYVSSVISGFNLVGAALRIERGQAQITWRRKLTKEKLSETISSKGIMVITPQDQDQGKKPSSIAASAARSFLQERGQPAEYLAIHAAALASIAEESLIMDLERSASESSQPPVSEFPPAEIYNKIQSIFKEAFTFPNGFIRFGGGEQSLDTGRWWLRGEHDYEKVVQAPLADRVEEAVVRYLQKHPGCSLVELDQALCLPFPGLLTPDPQLIQICLESYGEEGQNGENTWSLRPQDTPASRRTDLNEMRELITEIGQRLKYSAIEEQAVAESTLESNLRRAPVLWKDEQGNVKFAFYVIASSNFGRIMDEARYPPQCSLIVLPGSRSNLVAYKLQEDPRLREIVDQGWRFIKFRHLRWLAESPLVSRESLDEQFSQDTLTFTAPQMRLL